MTKGRGSRKQSAQCAAPTSPGSCPKPEPPNLDAGPLQGIGILHFCDNPPVSLGSAAADWCCPSVVHSCDPRSPTSKLVVVTFPHDEPLCLRHPTATFWRSPDTLQMGEGSSGVLLNHVPPAVADAVELLNAPRTRTEIAQRLPHLDGAWLDWLYAHLSSAGLLRSATERTSGVIRVVGNGTLARDLSTALSNVGIRTSTQPSHATELGPSVSLALLANSTAEPDRVVTDRLVGDGIAHLITRIEPHRAVVGPFVLPGNTPCLHCDDLARAHADRSWAHHLAQLCRQEVRPDPGLLQWAVATSVAQVRAWHSGYIPELAGSCLQLDVAESRLRHRHWAAHPDCRCGSVSLATLADCPGDHARI